ncbi:TonB-dependent receptor domain-containing protein [Sphingomonas quercus]|uniref:TonB-dependent receptor n=1 Tax=Sphingomonas quercus TaxID=2842451 RepID=A0ABS6BIT0_9SPHN|nr:TonB-dependent receptor [Sphingomonas quercus]MBU3078225.1 TonB-dependent receptor [Sphingomonas quercus]
MIDCISARVYEAGARRALFATTALALSLGLAAPAFAQDQAPAPANAEPTSPPASAPLSAAPAQDEIVVTGSSIRGVAPVGSALIGVTRDTIQATAPANTKELLSNVPQLGNFGANAEQSTPNRYRTPGFQPNIHNLGMYATLTLANGHRIAPVGTEAVLPDPSIIPVIAVQRVEIIADGASSVYGSDAVAGVVNFIYRKNVEGIEASGTFGWNDTRYRKYDASILAGHSWGTGSIMAAYEYSQNKSPLTRDIDFLALGGDQRSRGGRDLRPTTCLLPNVTASGTVYAYQANGTFRPGRNQCGLLDEKQTIIPDAHRHAVLVTARQEAGDKVELWTELNYSNYKTFRWGGRPSLTLNVPSTNPYFRLPDGVTADRITVVRSGLGLFPSGAQPQSSKFWGVTAGADIHLGGNWVANIMGHVSKTNDWNQEAPELDQLAATRLAAGTTLSTALNPFGQAADNDPAVLAQINNDYAQINVASQRLRELQAKADGPLFAIPGGDVRMAIGADFRVEQLVQRQTAGAPGVDLLTVRDDNISRTVTSAFAEFNVPLFSELNARPFFQALTLSISGRLDYYDKYGTIFNPKYGANWSPVRGVTVHGSYSTSFAAPNMGMITSTFTVPRPNSAINLTDVTTGEFLGTINQLNPGGGNPNLQPEKATSWSMGVDFVPQFVPGLRLSATYYEVEYRNTVYQPTTADVLTNPQFAMFRILHPTQAQIDDMLRMMPPQGPITTGFDALIYYNAQNLGVKQVAGVDIDGSYRIDTASLGSFNLGIIANRQTRYKQQTGPGAAFVSRLGTNDAPKWKTRFQAGWSLDPVVVNLFANYVGSYRYTAVNPAQKVDSWLTFDLTAALDLSKMIHDGVSLQARVVNLFDKDPPFVDNANGYLPALASPFGRQFEVTLRAKF